MTEDDVKRAIIPFLKEFYRYRYEPRPGSEVATLDNVSSGGLVADVMLYFKKQDESTFLCACEATARGNEDEVRYRLNQPYFLWDCVAFAAVFSVTIYAVFFIIERKWLIDLQVAGNFGMLLGQGIIGFFIWYFTMANWRKYRYILAIEQFKQYFADEQWIAVSEDVFPAPTDPYLQELRRQCIYQGFGLAIVNAQGAVRAIANPSRIGIFGKDRRMVEWVTQTSWFQRANSGVAVLRAIQPKMPEAGKILFNKITRPIRENLLTPFANRLYQPIHAPMEEARMQVNRFMKGQRLQKAVFFACLLILLPMLYRVLRTNEGEKFADFSKYNPAQGGYNPEDVPGANYETGPIPIGAVSEQGGIPKQYLEPTRLPPGDVPTSSVPGYVPSEVPLTPTQRIPPPAALPAIDTGPAEENIQTIDLSGDQEITISPEAEPERETPRPQSAAPTQARPPINTSRPLVEENCLKGRSGYLIQENAYSLRNNAEARVKNLRQLGFQAFALPKNCLEPGTEGYLVFLGDLWKSRTTAISKSNELVKQLGLSNKKLLIRGLNVK